MSLHDSSASLCKRIDLHCHSKASTEADEAVLIAINCPESYSEPAEVYAQAKRRGMDFVTISDHDTIAGVITLLDRPDVLIGEEFTCYFPEDHCKMHVLIWGVNAEQHAALQSMAQNIYQCAEYIEQQQIAHAVAHPLYRQNDLLEKWHLERLVLIFKGFECLNGAHSLLHRVAFEPMLDELTLERIELLSKRHQLQPRWPEPWKKTRTAGSDDHGLFNIGRTWTNFPADTDSIEKILACLREGKCSPGGEAGSSLKLAHNFFSVGVRYHSREMSPKNSRPSLSISLLQMMVGERKALRKRDLVKLVVKSKIKSVGRTLTTPFRRKPAASGTALLAELFTNSIKKRVGEFPQLAEAMKQGLAPLGEHETVFALISALNRDVSQGIADSISAAVQNGQMLPIFDALSAVTAQQFVLLPYYFALFHQNRERHHLGRLTGHGRVINKQTMKLGVFTDTFDEINGVSRFVQDMSRQANAAGRSMIVHTCCKNPKAGPAWRKNFEPLVTAPLPGLDTAQFTLNIPPIAELMEWADRQQFDAIHVDTPGPMGLAGMLVAKMLRVPLLSTYHTDYPGQVYGITQDHRLTCATAGYMGWFFKHSTLVFSRSREYQAGLRKLQIAEEKLAMTPPAIDTEKFNPRHREADYWSRHGINKRFKLLHVGRLTPDRNLSTLVAAFKELCQNRQDTALIIAGDGPYLQTMRRELTGLPAHFLGQPSDAGLASLYANADLFLFPSRTSTLGQVIIEAQASGLPVLVSDEGGPKEVMDDEVTGYVLPATDVPSWVQKIELLLTDDAQRQRMSRTAPQRMTRFSLAKTFDGFWDEHVKAVRAADEAMLVAEKTPAYSPIQSDEQEVRVS